MAAMRSLLRSLSMVMTPRSVSMKYPRNSRHLAGPVSFILLQRKPSQRKTSPAMRMCSLHCSFVSATMRRSSTYIVQSMPMAVRNCTISPDSALANGGASRRPSGSPRCRRYGPRRGSCACCFW